MNYIYYFLNFKNEIIYVGKTKDITKRMKQHFFKGHLPQECYDSVYRIKFSEVNDSKCDTEICETILINKYKPIYNTDKKFNQNSIKTSYKELDLNFKELFFTFYDNELITSTRENFLFYKRSFSINEKINYALKNNLGVLKHKKAYIMDITKSIYFDNNKILDLLLDLNQNIIKYIEPDYTDLDEPININSEYLSEGYIAFNIDLLKEFELKDILSLINSYFVFKITDEIYATPIYTSTSLKKINQAYDNRKDIISF